MNERLLVALSCGGEFVAALQIEAALLGRGRLPRWAAAGLLCLLWAGSQVLWGTYVPYSPWALTFNALRMLAAAFFFGGGLLQKAFSVVVCGVVILGYGNTVGALAAGLNKMPMSEIWRLPQSILLYGVVLNALLYLGIRLLRRWIGAIDPVQKVVGTVYICLIALLNVILTNFGQDTDQYSYMVLICILLILATLVYFARFTMLSVRSTQASQTEARMKIEQERADALMESYQSQRRLSLYGSGKELKLGFVCRIRSSLCYGRGDGVLSHRIYSCNYAKARFRRRAGSGRRPTVPWRRACPRQRRRSCRPGRNFRSSTPSSSAGSPRRNCRFRDWFPRLSPTAWWRACRL